MASPTQHTRVWANARRQWRTECLTAAVHGVAKSDTTDWTTTAINLGRFLVFRASLVAQLVKNPPAMRKTWVLSLGWEDPLEKGKAYPLQYSGLENSRNCIVHGVAKSRTRLSNFHTLSLYWFSIYFFLSSSHISIMHILHLVLSSQSSWIFHYILFGLFSLCFSVLYISTVIFSRSEILSLTISCLLVSPSKAFFISASVFDL